MAISIDADGNYRTTSNNKSYFVTRSDLKKLRELAQMHCTVQEIADIFGCTRDTIYKNAEVMAIIKEEKAKTNYNLRKRMQQRAEYDGENATLLNISQSALEWLHKWRLGDREKTAIIETDAPKSFLPPAVRKTTVTETIELIKPESEDTNEE